MAQQSNTKIISANALLSGEVIYLTASGTWSPHHGKALMISSIDVGEDLLTTASMQGDIVGAYLADATLDELGQPAPKHYREAFRASGPSNLFHGKQADFAP